jgi:hypothetical protein
MVSRIILAALGGALGGALITRFARSEFPSLHAKAPGNITPARAAIHGELMNNCIDPKKLQRGAALFGQEGLTYHAESLFRKAQEIHEMMHGARSIVERCRAGDQHAMAMAKGIGEQARAGNPRAQLSSFFIEEYTKAYPNLDESYYDGLPDVPQTVTVPVHTVEPTTMVAVPAHKVEPTTMVAVPATQSSPPVITPAHTVAPTTIVSAPAHAVEPGTMVTVAAHAA